MGLFSALKNFDNNKSLKKLESSNINSLIIDVRNNNGGYLKTATEVSSMFLKKGQTIYQLSSKFNGRNSLVSLEINPTNLN